MENQITEEAKKEDLKNEDVKSEEVKEEFPTLMSAKQLVKYSGLALSRAYDCMNCQSAPVVVLGGRKFMIRDKFLPWLEEHFGISVVG